MQKFISIKKIFGNLPKTFSLQLNEILSLSLMGAILFSGQTILRS